MIRPIFSDILEVFFASETYSFLVDGLKKSMNKFYTHWHVALFTELVAKKRPDLQ